MMWVKCSDRLPSDKTGQYVCENHKTVSEVGYLIWINSSRWSNSASVPDGWYFQRSPGDYVQIEYLKNLEWLEETPIVFPSEDEIDLFSQETEQGVPRPTDRIIGVEIGAKWAIQKIKEQL